MGAQDGNVNGPGSRKLGAAVSPRGKRTSVRLERLRSQGDAGQRAGPLLKVLDEVIQPKVTQATADEIFLAPNRS